ncbi:uncharacterized protein BJ171DRAFT_457514 [Polychytrium aggregatum]|uniref:uncharacterized protein n=1 Tax=Polychytrium aggregatum TaxID=110093 RepID=UPI0022FDC5E7|nr:uncharacterized protein BJ171DRAFT_457514 [Polychytrium aggregatum]KAI9206485.1 hypothetical protein BJ171DRAFT_457514 [Polychytrium aggregatum]
MGKRKPQAKASPKPGTPKDTSTASEPRRQKSRHASRHDDDDGSWDEGTRVLQHQLGELGLLIKDMTGDGNCLFRALSDQWDGTPDYHAKHRKEVCVHIDEKREYYEPFLVDESLDQYVKRMCKHGTYGGNLEIVAFSRLHNVKIAVHQASTPIWIVKPDMEGQPAKGSAAPMVHIVYHSWEHYSSVRNADGPYEGHPRIVLKPTTLPPLEKPDPSAPANHMERTIMSSTGCHDLNRIRKLLVQSRGDPGRVMSILFDEAEAEAEAEATRESTNDTLDENSLQTGTETQDSVQTAPALPDPSDSASSGPGAAASSEPAESAASTPKKPQSRARKREEAKKLQKEKALAKKRNKTKGDVAAEDKSVGTAGATDADDVDQVLVGLKAVCI